MGIYYLGKEEFLRRTFGSRFEMGIYYLGKEEILRHLFETASQIQMGIYYLKSATILRPIYALFMRTPNRQRLSFLIHKTKDIKKIEIINL